MTAENLRNIRIENLPLVDLVPDPRNARLHSKSQLEILSRAIKSFGFNNPVLIDKNNFIVAGHGRVEAARNIGMTELPVIRLEHLTNDQIRAYRIADNRIAELATWDEEMLRIEFQEMSILNLDFDLTVTGFNTPQIDLMILGNHEKSSEDDWVDNIEDNVHPVSRLGDIWSLGNHKILCGNSLELDSYSKLLGEERADIIFTDPPYNVPINGHVLTQSGKSSHDEFAMASGEMSAEAFQAFLRTISEQMVRFSKDGSIHFICMDWRHIYDLLHAAGSVYTELKNICIWNKTNGGMGSFYRSKYEMVAVFKNGSAPHVNNIELGKHGRYRTNVWDYAGQNIPTSEREEALTMHPTVKPIKMIEDALYDSSHRKGIVLDPFGGSGSTLIAAEKAGRYASLIEISPRYVDVTISRWERMSKKDAIHLSSGQTFSERQKFIHGDVHG